MDDMVGCRYLAPEYFMHGIVDERTDVFAFGVLLLELITGRHAVDSDSRQSLVTWVSLHYLSLFIMISDGRSKLSVIGL